LIPFCVFVFVFVFVFESRSLLESSVEEGFKTTEEYYDNLGKKVGGGQKQN